jgi:hypothetical protein
MKGEGGEINHSPLSHKGRGVGGEGEYKKGTLPVILRLNLFPYHLTPICTRHRPAYIP